MNSKTILLVLITVNLMSSCGPDKNIADEKTNRSSSQKTVCSTPDEALKELKTGNYRFITGKLINTNFKDQIEATKKNQSPHSVILSCMDSRVPPEIIFDQGIGNIFVIRNAGNLEDKNVLGSLEYAVHFSSAELIVVMGHSHCGAVNGAITDIEGGHLTQLLDQIKPSIPKDSTHPYLHEETTKHSVRTTIKDILKDSELIKKLYFNNKIKIVAAFYEVETGKVTFSEYIKK